MGASRIWPLARLSLPTLGVSAALLYGCNLLIDVGGYTHATNGDDGGTLDASTHDAATDGGVDAAPPPGASALKWARWRMPNGIGAPQSPSLYEVHLESKTVVDTVTKRTWSQDTTLKNTYEEARAFCASKSLGGASFRLPTRIELVSLLDYSGTNPSGAKIAVTSQLDLAPLFYWTQSYLPPRGDGTFSFWMVNFLTGTVEERPGTTSNSGVACVLDTQ